MSYEVVIIFISILFSAFFSGMEIAFISSNRLYLELEKKKGDFISKILTTITEKSSRFITTMLVGNNISLVVYSYFMGELLMNWFHNFLPSEIAIVNYLLEDLQLLTQTLISTVVILVTAEFLPKALFRVYANEAIKIFAIPAYIFFYLFYFLSSFISAISDFFLRVIFKTEGDEIQTEFSKEELGNYITEQLETNKEDEEVDSEIQIFQNALEFHKVKAREIMVPRIEIVAVELHETVSNLKKAFIESGYSKILVYNNSLDDVIGYVNSYELFKRPRTIKSILLAVEIVPESMMISDVLNVLMKKRKSIALVVDEYGGTSGIITVEDIVEELFGEIEDEHDSLDLLEEKISETEFNFSARLEVDYLNEEYNLNIPKEEAYETLGGFIINHTESIPEQDEEIQIDNFKIRISKVSSTKIDSIHLEVLPTES
ncbi:CBS domain containing-hemolysin-like protein [Tenacibaculum skagerrakense]|uniref:CBS domain containing-hemolysin-like protein n=1 Tax=Tenacibaculum skagerrakense TaxID=186571 RepID=A0A4R2P1H6_9FLAO|nr:hemolysin family protein [Tenacibaculum skagerrakense]TCP28543.1 CBS domain containing-hemolysin-like protein [Tenacibaculum skagerrakense]